MITSPAGQTCEAFHGCGETSTGTNAQPPGGEWLGTNVAHDVGVAARRCGDISTRGLAAGTVRYMPDTGGAVR